MKYYITQKGSQFINERSRKQKEAERGFEDDETTRGKRARRKNRAIDDTIEAGRIKLFSKDSS